MEIALGVIALLSLTAVAVAAPGVIRQHRRDIALRNYTRQVTQVSHLMQRLGYEFDKAADMLREFSEAWDPEVVKAAKAEA